MIKSWESPNVSLPGILIALQIIVIIIYICRTCFPGGKARPGRVAYHSPPSSAEVKNE
jgi:hypothetical protein